ncbi:MAG TPA: hypothetical protein VGI81_11170 [Tepidisphaeraceae bacterium]
MLMTNRGLAFAALAVVLCGGALLAAPTSYDHAASSGKSTKTTTTGVPPPPADLAWPELTDDEQEQSVKLLKKMADEAQAKLHRPLQLYETKYFLFYTDLSAREGKNWSGLLDRMYARLCETFGVPGGKNIWRGKGLVFVFSKPEDYLRFESEIAHTPAKGTAGMCHSVSNGLDFIAFYRQPDEMQFAHVLVHESTHGFVHRYRSKVFVPSWANEGLAEVIATDLVPQRGHRDQVKTAAREALQQHRNSMEDFFTAEHIQGWQYPVAQMLCEFMITAGKKNYVDFINGIKDGLSWDEAMTTRYKAPVDRLVPVFGQWLGLKNLSPGTKE